MGNSLYIYFWRFLSSLKLLSPIVLAFLQYQINFHTTQPSSNFIYWHQQNQSYLKDRNKNNFCIVTFVPWVIIGFTQAAYYAQFLHRFASDILLKRLGKLITLHLAFYYTLTKQNHYIITYETTHIKSDQEVKGFHPTF